MNLLDIIEQNVVFISTASVDKDLCIKFCNELRSLDVYHWCMHRGYNLFPNNDIRCMNIFNNFQRDIDAALKHCSIFVLLVTENIFKVSQNGHDLKIIPEIQREIDSFAKLREKNESLIYLPVKCFEGESITLYANRDGNNRNFMWDDIREIISINSTEHREFVDYANLYLDIADGLESVVSQIMEKKQKYDFRQITEYLKNLKSERILLDLQNKCIQEAHVTNKVSDYILTSGELSSDDEFSEIHILSNELQHYDCTTISSLAIAVNIQRNMKYIYYIPKSSEDDFETLLKRVSNFVKRNHTALEEINLWFKNRFCEIYGTLDFLLNNFNKNHGRYVDVVSNYYQYLPNDKQEEIRYIYNQIYAYRINQIANVIKWLKNEACDGNPLKTLMAQLRKILELTESTGPVVHYKAKEIYDQFTLLTKLYDFSEWLLGSKVYDDSNERDEMLDYIFNEDIIKGVREVKEYIVKGGDTSPGEAHITDDDVENYMKNIVCIDLSCMRNIYPCYSFCLYINEIKDRSVAWYTCHANADITVRHADADIVIYAPINNHRSRQVCDEFTSTFLTVVENTKGAKDKLMNCNSKLLEFRN